MIYQRPTNVGILTEVKMFKTWSLPSKNPYYRGQNQAIAFVGSHSSSRADKVFTFNPSFRGPHRNSIILEWEWANRGEWINMTRVKSFHYMEYLDWLIYWSWNELDLYTSWRCGIWRWHHSVLLTTSAACVPLCSAQCWCPVTAAWKVLYPVTTAWKILQW